MRTDRPTPQTRSDTPDSDVVLSSRVRLARNLASEPFVHRCDESTMQKHHQHASVCPFAGRPG